MDPTIRTSAKAGSGVIELGIGVVQPKQRGFFNFLEQGKSSPESLNEQKQKNLWAKSNLWAGITKDNAGFGGLIP